MSSIDVPLKKGGFGTTSRTDNWWVEPLLIFLGYLSFILYANYAVFNVINILSFRRHKEWDYFIIV